MSCQPLKPLKYIKEIKQEKTMEQRLINAAKVFMIEYMSDGKTRVPSDFDWDILGDSEFMVFGLPRWNATPFFYALGELVEEGKVIHKELKDGTQTYKIKI
jgi:hypothetical protein